MRPSLSLRINSSFIRRTTDKNFAIVWQQMQEMRQEMQEMRHQLQHNTKQIEYLMVHSTYSEAHVERRIHELEAKKEVKSKKANKKQKLTAKKLIAVLQNGQHAEHTAIIQTQLSDLLTAIDVAERNATAHPETRPTLLLLLAITLARIAADRAGTEINLSDVAVLIWSLGARAQSVVDEVVADPLLVTPTPEEMVKLQPYVTPDV